MGQRGGREEAVASFRRTKHVCMETFLLSEHGAEQRREHVGGEAGPPSVLHVVCRTQTLPAEPWPCRRRRCGWTSSGAGPLLSFLSVSPFVSQVAETSAEVPS